MRGGGGSAFALFRLVALFAVLPLAQTQMLRQFSESPSLCTWFKARGGRPAHSSTLKHMLSLRPGTVGQNTCRVNASHVLPQILGSEFFELFVAAEELCSRPDIGATADSCRNITADIFLSQPWSANLMRDSTRLERHRRRLLAGKGRPMTQKMVLLSNGVSRQRKQRSTVVPLGCLPSPSRFSQLLLGPQRYASTLAWLQGVARDCNAHSVTTRYDPDTDKFVSRCVATEAGSLCKAQMNDADEAVCDVNEDVLMMTMFGGMDGPLARIMSWEDECGLRTRASCAGASSGGACDWVFQETWLDFVTRRELKRVPDLAPDDPPAGAAGRIVQFTTKYMLGAAALAGCVVAVVVLLIRWRRRRRPPVAVLRR